MQANKASRQTTEELKRWLEKPTTSAAAGTAMMMTASAKEDLRWLEEQKDLSAVVLNGNEKARSVKSNGGGGSGAGGSWGLAALFGCAGKRK